MLQLWVFYSIGCLCPVRAIFRRNIIPQDGTGWQPGCHPGLRSRRLTRTSPALLCTPRFSFPVCCRPYLQHCANTQTQGRTPPSTRGNCLAGSTTHKGTGLGWGPVLMTPHLVGLREEAQHGQNPRDSRISKDLSLQTKASWAKGLTFCYAHFPHNPAGLTSFQYLTRPQHVLLLI